MNYLTPCDLYCVESPEVTPWSTTTINRPPWLDVLPNTHFKWFSVRGIQQWFNLSIDSQSVTISSVLHAWVFELWSGVEWLRDPLSAGVVCLFEGTGGRGGGCRGLQCNSSATPGHVCPPQATFCFFLAWCLIGHALYTCSNQPPFIAKKQQRKRIKNRTSQCYHVLLIDRNVQSMMPLAIWQLQLLWVHWLCLFSLSLHSFCLNALGWLIYQYYWPTPVGCQQVME